jgi:hypothetical protein
MLFHVTQRQGVLMAGSLSTLVGLERLTSASQMKPMQKPTSISSITFCPAGHQHAIDSYPHNFPELIPPRLRMNSGNGMFAQLSTALRS